MSEFYAWDIAGSLCPSLCSSNALPTVILGFPRVPSTCFCTAWDGMLLCSHGSQLCLILVVHDLVLLIL